MVISGGIEVKYFVQIRTKLEAQFDEERLTFNEWWFSKRRTQGKKEYLYCLGHSWTLVYYDLIKGLKA